MRDTLPAFADRALDVGLLGLRLCGRVVLVRQPRDEHVVAQRVPAEDLVGRGQDCRGGLPSRGARRVGGLDPVDLRRVRAQRPLDLQQPSMVVTM